MTGRPPQPRHHPSHAETRLEAEEMADADRQLRDAYRRQPIDPELIQSAQRLAAETAPDWEQT